MITGGTTRTIEIEEEVVIVIVNQIEISAARAMIGEVTTTADSNPTRKTKVETTEVLMTEETDPTLVNTILEGTTWTEADLEADHILTNLTAGNPGTKKNREVGPIHTTIEEAKTGTNPEIDRKRILDSRIV